MRKTFPGVTFAFSQYIQDNVQEAASGIDAENAIKITGPDLATLRKIAVEIRGVLEKVRGITDIQVPPLLGQPTIRIDIDRQKAARYGLSPGDINATIQAAVGGIFGLFLADMPFSTSAAIGFVALFGIAAMNGIMVVGCYNRLIESGLERERALSETCGQQMRPVLMTCVAACVGLIPAAFSTAIGSQVQRPLAVVVVGGTLLAPILILTVLPAALSIFSRRRPEVPTESDQMVKA